MAMDQNASGRRPHYHRGRRGTDRRGNDRRSAAHQQPDQGSRSSGDSLDVEQIMRDIRARISQRGIDLSNEQIRDLAARRLEAILDPRQINATLLDQLRQGAAAPPEPLPTGSELEYSITDDAVYEGGAAVRFFRRLFRPLLKLLFNPAPLVSALQAQSRLNREWAARAAEIERRQTEWNALHYQIVQRLVTEVSRASIDTQSMNSRIESLGARVDFTDRRLRALEATATPARNPRPQEMPAAPAVPAGSPASASSESAVAPGSASAGDTPRRRRRRRRGRRGSPLPGATEPTADASAANLGATDVPDDADIDDSDEDESADTAEGFEPAREFSSPAASADAPEASQTSLDESAPALPESTESASVASPLEAEHSNPGGDDDRVSPAPTPTPDNCSSDSENAG